MSALLMDTNALIWFMNGDPMSTESLRRVAEAQRTRTIFVSAISGWEAGLALKKKSGRPNLGGREGQAWFQAVLAVPGIRLINLAKRIAIEAAAVPHHYGNGDPGDCFLIATARIKKIPIVTRDQRMTELSLANPNYLTVIEC